jgi:hypothetical protein
VASGSGAASVGSGVADAHADNTMAAIISKPKTRKIFFDIMLLLTDSLFSYVQVQVKLVIFGFFFL